MNDKDTASSPSELDKTTPRPWRVVDRRGAPLPNVIIVGADESIVFTAEGVHMRDKMLQWTLEQAVTADERAIKNAELTCIAVNSCTAKSQAVPVDDERVKAEEPNG